MFRAISSRANFPALEEAYLRFWEEERVFERSVEQRRGGPSYILYEGPPTANGNPGLHHVLARVFKDLFPRYKAMKGYYAPRQAGWDCHGLPVELEVEKELGLSSKAQIESYGVEGFNRRCRESVFRYLKDWEALTRRIAFWVDLEHPYITMTNEYIESCWWIIKRLWDGGLIYQGQRTTPHCPRCGTSLSSHEVAQGYRDDTQDPSIYIKFRLTPQAQARLSLDKPSYFLAWTTTPWTLPGNTALAVAEDAEYVMVEVGGEDLILAEALLGEAGLSGKDVVARFKGKDLVGLFYDPLFPPEYFGVEVWGYNKKWKAWIDKVDPLSVLAYPVISANFVSMDEGTGIVHIAPAFGEVDYEAGKEQGLYFIQPVDLQGMMTGSYPFSGRFVKEADPLVVKDLSSRGLLYKSGTITHTYPFCWRCDTPLLYYVKPSWYIRTTAVKDLLLKRNQEINWYPEHIKEGRFGDWLENNVDWALSRERYWGTPLPIWNCHSCGWIECMGSVDDIKKFAPHQAMTESGRSLEECLKDLHRPFVDDIILKCPQCQGVMRRLPEVIDCWFDSGAMPVAQWHYPFENQDTFKEWYPADYISEAVDQTRGWFYTLHAIASLLEASGAGMKAPCFKNVICLGLILDAKGEKMSKARGNVVDPWQVIAAHGADALRWYMLTASPPGNVRRFDVAQVTQVVRQFLLTLWNTYSFFVTYANIDRFDPGATPPPAPTSDLDRWILSELNLLIHQVTQELDSYEPPGAGRKLEDFVDNLSNWYVRRSRRRFWKSENDEDKLSAYFTLYRCLVTLAHLMAPFTPFLAEELYQNLVRPLNPQAPVSVHLSDFPQADLSVVDEALMEQTRLAIKVCSLGRAARSQGGIKVRQPLSKVLVQVRSAAERKGLEGLVPQMLEELNVKAVEFTDGEMGADSNLVSVEEGGYTVAIDTKLTPELRAEGLAREVVHRLQTLRRQAGFDIADHIITYYEAASPLKEVMRDFAAYIKQETLSREIVEGVPQESYQERQRLKEGEILLGVKKL